MNIINYFDIIKKPIIFMGQSSIGWVNLEEQSNFLFKANVYISKVISNLFDLLAKYVNNPYPIYCKDGRAFGPPFVSR